MNVPPAELLDAQGFLASLVGHQVRPRGRATREARPRIDASYPSKPCTGLIGAPDVAPPPSQKSALPVMTAHAAPLVSFPRPIETLLSQLARRRLPGFAPSALARNDSGTTGGNYRRAGQRLDPRIVAIKSCELNHLQARTVSLELFRMWNRVEALERSSALLCTGHLPGWL
jgi:hypothetical protein